MHGGDIYRNKVNIDYSVSVSPYGVPEAVMKAIRESVGHVCEYPDYNYEELTKAIADMEEVHSDTIVCTNGASELIQTAVQSIIDKIKTEGYRNSNKNTDTVSASILVPSFSGYEKALRAAGVDMVNKVLLLEENDFVPQEDDIDKLLNDAELIILGNPNNPTGKLLPKEWLSKLCQKSAANNTYIILDESFIRLTDEASQENYFNKSDSESDVADRESVFNKQNISKNIDYKNLVRVCSFTKSMCIPGVRIGYGIINDNRLKEEIMNRLPEWNVSVMAMYAGVAAAKCDKWLHDKVNDPINGLRAKRDYITNGLRAAGCKVLDSDTNFILFRVIEDCSDDITSEEAGMAESDVTRSENNTSEPGITRRDDINTESVRNNLEFTRNNNLYDFLLQKGILIRKCDDFAGLDDSYYRVAVKSEADNAKLINAISELLNVYAKNDTDVKASTAAGGLLKVLPTEIEAKSFEILTGELEDNGITLTGDTAPIIKRCIHTTADFDYASTLKFSENAVEIARELIRNGAHIVTDTNMALAGINKKNLAQYGGEVHCFMADEQIARIAKERGVTRATVSMEHAAKLDNKLIFAVGNAPTALVTLAEMIDSGKFRPDFVIGVPVGFVNVVMAKEMIMERDIPFIINAGRKGGSNVAAAIVNAILYNM